MSLCKIIDLDVEQSFVRAAKAPAMRYTTFGEEKYILSSPLIFPTAAILPMFF